LSITAAIYDKHRVQRLIKQVLQELGAHVQDVIYDVKEQVDIVWDYKGKLESEADQLESIQHAPH
jgi:delta 1-pyrroline-5-carboxylate dehydrogenase